MFNICCVASVTSLGLVQVGAMVIYILDAIQHREAALLAVWLCLGLMNMSFGLTVLFFTSTSSILISILMAVMNGITLFMTGKRSEQPHAQTRANNALVSAAAWAGCQQHG